MSVHDVSHECLSNGVHNGIRKRLFEYADGLQSDESADTNGSSLTGCEFFTWEIFGGLWIQDDERNVIISTAQEDLDGKL
jgi:hypothetical protein